MSKLMSLIRRAPKRFTAALTMIAAVIIVPAVVFAWGPTRQTYTVENPASVVTFNSITNNPNIGDERNFVGIREVGSENVWYDNMNVQDGKEYYVRMYVHNNAAENLNLVAENVTAKFNLPTTTGKSIQVDGFVNSSNATPTEVYDSATFTSGTDFNLAYVSGSLKYENNVFGSNGVALPESIFTSTGAKLGYDKLDGKIPGCFKYAGYVSFKVKPQVAKELNFSLTKKVSKHGANQWSKDYKAQPGEKVDFLLTYKNTGTAPNDDVTFRDTLPAQLGYLANSGTWSNVQKQNVKFTNDAALTNGTGINVGAYLPGGNAYIIFTATVAQKEQLACGTNKLVNKAKVNTGGYAVEDSATVTVDKECKPTVKYTCDALNIQKLSDTSVRFTTNYTVENATFKNVTYVIRNASGAEIDRKVSTSNTLDYTQTTAGKYSVQAIVTVTVDGQDKTATGPRCKGEFEIEKKIVHKYTCDSLQVVTLSRTTFRFTTNYTAENATFKGVTYTVRNANGQVVDTKTSTGTTLEYSQATPGDYTVQASVTFTVNGQDKTVTSDKCKAPFKVEKEKVVKYTCNALEISKISRTEFRFATAYSVENATFKSITYVVRNAAGTVVNTISATTNTSTYTQTQAGNYTVQATVHFTVNGEEKTATSEKCKGSFEVKDLPKEITVCKLATKEIVTIKESEFNPSIYSKNLDDCKEVPTPIKVCEIATKTIVTIDEKDFDASKYTKDLSKCAEVPPELPQTGTTENIVAVLGLGAMIASIAYYVASRRALNQ